MTKKSTSPADAPATHAAWNWGPQFSPRQFAVGTEGSAVLLRGFEAMRKIQAQAAQQALLRHAEAGRQLGGAALPAEALAIQSDMLRGDIEDATRCWQQLFGEALEVGNELMACSTRLVNTDDVFAAARFFHLPKA